MSSGYGANYADVIDENNIRKIPGCGKLLNELHACFNDAQKTLFTDCDIHFDKFAMDIAHEYDNIPEELFRQAERIYQELQHVFNKQTGLELYLGYHDSDNDGDCYDDVNGSYWCVAGCYTVSKCYAKSKSRFGINIPRLHFVTYG